MHETLKSLLVYSREHFQREEKIQRECMYPYATMHAEEHRRLISQVEDMARTYFIVKESLIDGAAIKVMNDLLKVWLIDHIKKFDTNMRDWVIPADQR
jgi:hemerythrin-like metal-binding protein